MTSEGVYVSFAGFGGSCEGARQALGRSPDVAINHWPVALSVHAVNHPKTLHLPEDVWQVNLPAVTKGRPVGMLWASPDCTDHSRAKGAKPRDNARRGLANVLLRWVDEVRPRVLLLENVPEFECWSGFDAWVAGLTAAGYEVEWRTLAADLFGAPTNRNRLYVVARCDGEAISWPAPTHGPGLLPVRTARPHIDLTDIGRAVGDHLSARTRQRIAVGLARRPGEAAWLTKYYATGSSQSLDEPLHTITTVDRFGLVSVVDGIPHLRMLRPRELLACQGFPPGYVIERGADGRKISRRDQIALIGNSVCPPVARALIEANYRPASVTAPVLRRPAVLPLFEVAA